VGAAGGNAAAKQLDSKERLAGQLFCWLISLLLQQAVIGVAPPIPARARLVRWRWVAAQDKNAAPTRPVKSPL
jgi:hypothetical protein